MASVALPIDDDLKAIRLRFVATIFAGSFLLFLVQPMIARMALPRLGGAPAVWNSAMLVYQGCCWPAMPMPLAEPQGGADPGDCPSVGLRAGRPDVADRADRGGSAARRQCLPVGAVLLLVRSDPCSCRVGAGPLMQRWLPCPAGAIPIRFSGLQSRQLSGLIAYPLLVEPLVPVALQSLGWSLAYGALMLLVAWCALRLPRPRNGTAGARRLNRLPGEDRRLDRDRGDPVRVDAVDDASPHPDIVAMPLLWVVRWGFIC